MINVKSTKKRFLSILFVMSAASILICTEAECLFALARASSTEPLIYRNIPYDSIVGVNLRLLSLDVYAVPDGRCKPVMVYVHGGGWHHGHKGEVLFKPEFSLSQGYVFVSINYRLSPEVKFPTHAQDVAKAIAWVHGHIGEYGGNPSRIFLMGHSAGAHLATLVGSDERYLNEQGLSLHHISGIVALDTKAYDIQLLMSTLPPDQGRLFKQVFGSDPDFWAFASPITYVKEGKNIPPMIIAYSGRTTSRALQAERFVATLREASVSAELLPAPRKTHAGIDWEFGVAGDEVTEAVRAFLLRIQSD